MAAKSILLVDDDLFLSEAIQDFLKGCGYEVAYADNGFEGIRLSQEQDFNMILIDYKMPGMTGDIACRMIRSRRPNSYIVGYSNEPKDEEFLHAGASRFIPKLDLAMDFSLLDQLAQAG